MSVQQPLMNPQDLGDISSKVVGFLQEHGKKIVIVGCLAGAALIVTEQVKKSSENEQARVWSKFATAEGAAGLGGFATDHQGSVAGTWARLLEAEQSFRDGVRLQFSDRKGAESELKRAGEAFDKVLGTANAPAVATERALIGKARLLETTSDGNFEKALEAYNAFLQKYPESIYKDSVQERIDALKKPGTKDFYAWFAKQDPKPTDRRRPNDGLPPGHPEIPVSLPEIPDSLYPANWSELKSDAELEEKPTAEKAADDKKPATEKPAEEVKTDEKPAAEKKDETKSEDKAAEDKKPAADGEKK